MYTIDQLLIKENKNYISDKQLLLTIINERANRLTNIYSPLSIRLKELASKIGNGEISVPEN